MSDLSLPPRFVARLAELLPPDRLHAVLAGFTDDKPVAARINPLRAPPDARAQLVAAGLHLTDVPWCPEGFSVPFTERAALLDHPLVADGSLYVQSASSWLPVLALDVQPGQEVLDLAAAPGGKTTHLAARMQDQGRLAAVEAVRDRFFRLKANVDRAGATCVALYLKDGRDVGRQVPARFDRVLLDAPCSSESRFELGKPDTWAHWSEAKIAEAARKQKGLILSAFDALKPGGRMVYATCSLAPEEDEAIVDQLLKKRDEADLLPIDLPGVPIAPGLHTWEGRTYDPRVEQCGRIWPDATLDAFFVALIARRA